MIDEEERRCPYCKKSKREIREAWIREARKHKREGIIRTSFPKPKDCKKCKETGKIWEMIDNKWEYIDCPCKTITKEEITQELKSIKIDLGRKNPTRFIGFDQAPLYLILEPTPFTKALFAISQLPQPQDIIIEEVDEETDETWTNTSNSCMDLDIKELFGDFLGNRFWWWKPMKINREVKSIFE